MAIVGGWGSGKSTIAALLTLLYDPTSSNSNHATTRDDNEPPTPIIKIANHDILTLPPSNLQPCIGIVSQEPLLFNGTIRDNIRYGRRSASDLEVWEAARIAHVLEFAEGDAEGLGTEVGTWGVQLSGGQK